MKMKTTTTIVLNDKEADALFKLLGNLTALECKKAGLDDEEDAVITEMVKQWNKDK